MPAAGEDPQLDAQSRVPLLVGLSVAFVAVSTVAVLLRLFTRYAVVRAPGTDDLTIAVAQFLSIGVSITTILQAKYALGRHVWVTNQTDQLKQLKAFFAGMLVYNLAQILTKLSFLFQYRRIFQDERTRRACLWLLMLLTAWGVAQEILVGFSCVPVSMFIPGHRAMCINSLVVWYLTSIMNIVTDFVVFMVPMPAIKNLQLQRKQKILVTSVFCLGFL
ncbi:hypothetical protein VTK73DRAFT_2950 [Phialemonium thermophilum]|uniref:Rhodopsin domain-containing protein n=1 Tax=Phialemonium thermophilum TaxID=223376 RepID=A0ABR3VPV0_9PEZI